MAQLHQQKNGIVWIRDDGKNYSDTLENFALDFGEPLPPLPQGVIDRLYDPGIRHPLHGAEGVLDGGPMPWPFGDRAIAAIDRLLQSQKARRETAPTP